MKILDLKTHVLSTPLTEEFAFSMGWVNRRSTMIVELITDDGVTGWGEALCHGLQPPEIAASIVQAALKPIVIGQDPFDVDVLWERMYNLTRPFGQKGAVPNAISAVDIAIWDCLGRALRKPIHKLLGGAYRSEVQPYATGFYRLRNGRYPADAVAEAKAHLANGFTAMKLKIGFGVEEDADYVLAVRDAVGPKTRLMVDANHAYNVGTARRLLKAIEPARIHWFEEPISPEDIDGYRELKNLTDIYLAAGENEFTKIGFREWISRRAVDILQPDLCSAGGFTECRKISALAQAWAHADRAACVGLGHRARGVFAIHRHAAARAAGAAPDRADARIRPVRASIPPGPDPRRDHDGERHGSGSRRAGPGRRDQS
jgi:D-galactarolactone cycloisomerase